MNREKNIEVSDVIQEGIKKLPSAYVSSPDKQKVIQSLISCRTAQLGGHVTQCNRCGIIEQSYNSCWNRHCPKCQGGASFNWVIKRSKELLPVPYFHIVFTLPSELRDLCFRNKKQMYNMMFQAASESMQAATTRRHDVELGYFGILHTWNQELQFHPHIHFVVPAGGLDQSGSWKSFPIADKFFLPVLILGKLFKGKFISLLKEAYRKNQLYVERTLSHLENPREFEKLISKAAKPNWVIYAKRPFGGPEMVLKYLSSYTHKVGISNKRLLSLSSEKVSFLARQKTNPGKKRVVIITPEGFTRRFLLHLIPKGFRRIRYFGFLNNAVRAHAIQQIQAQLQFLPPIIPTPIKSCTNCMTGSLSILWTLKPHRSSLHQYKTTRWLPLPHQRLHAPSQKVHFH